MKRPCDGFGWPCGRDAQHRLEWPGDVVTYACAVHIHIALLAGRFAKEQVATVTTRPEGFEGRKPE